jgi:hypothetical protein
MVHKDNADVNIDVCGLVKIQNDMNEELLFQPLKVRHHAPDTTSFDARLSFS